MNRNESLRVVYRNLFFILIITTIALIFASYSLEKGRVLATVFLFGNLGAYAAIHSKLKELSDEKVIELAQSWFALLTPSLIGGILAIVLYFLFISGIIGGELFPVFEADSKPPIDKENFSIIFAQHGKEFSDYGKLLVWSFIAGFSEKYVVGVLDSVNSNSMKQI
jgi:ammonia channel protein AmtB